MKRTTTKLKQFHLLPDTKINASQIARQLKRFFCTGDNQNNIHIWQFKTPDPVISLPSNPNQSPYSEILALTFTNDENSVVSGSNRGVINIWDIEAAKISSHLKGHCTSVTCLKPFPFDDERLATGSFDTNIKLWDLRTRQSTTTVLKGHSQQITTIDISPDQTLLLSGSSDGTIKLWDLRSPSKLITTYTDHHPTPVHCVKFHPEDIMFASAGGDRTVKYFHCEPGRYQCMSSTGVMKSNVSAIEFSAEGGGVLYTAGDGCLKVWGMGRDGVMVESVESEWRGVQDLCKVGSGLVGVAFSGGALSLWSCSISDQKKQSGQDQKTIVFKNVRQFNEFTNEDDDGRDNANTTLDKIQTSKKKKRTLEKIMRKKKKQQGNKQQQDFNQQSTIQLINKNHLNLIAPEINNPPQSNQQIPHQLPQQENTTQQDHPPPSIPQTYLPSPILRASQFLINRQQFQKFSQLARISQILQQSSKFSAVLNHRLTKVKPILNQWSTNNLKSAIHALNESPASVVIDALTTILKNDKMKSVITVEVAIALCTKLTELVLDKHAQYVRSGILLLNQIVQMWKGPLIRLHNLEFENEVLKEKVGQVHKLRECFEGIFKMRRVVKYAKTPTYSELHPAALTLSQTLEQILEECPINPTRSPN